MSANKLCSHLSLQSTRCFVLVLVLLSALFLCTKYLRIEQGFRSGLYFAPVKKALHTTFENGQRRFPDLIGIGVRKCGTGVYMTFLKKHGSIRVPNWRNYETEYFTVKHHRGLDWYQERFRPTPDDQLAMEKTPHYFYAAPKSIPEDILKVNPDTKIFLLLCDPTPRAYSCYVKHHRAPWLKYGAEAFEAWVARRLPKLKAKLSELNETSAEDYLFKIWNTDAECLLAGLYSVHIERWKKYFDEKHMLVLDGEAIMKNPGPEYVKLQKFFGIPINIREQDWVKNKTSGHFCLLPPEDRSSMFCLGKKKGRTRSPTAKQPNKETMEELKKFYKPYNEKLFKSLDVRYDWL